MGIKDKIKPQKAYFGFWTNDNKSSFKYYPVMINPSEISYNIISKDSKRVKGIEGKDEKSSEKREIIYAEKPDENINMSLTFDLATKYENLKFTDKEKYSIKNDLNKNKEIAFYNLRKAMNKKNYVRFVWGGLDLSGYITSFDNKFTYFSEYGHPLRTEVTLTLTASVIDTRNVIPDSKPLNVKTEDEDILDVPSALPPIPAKPEIATSSLSELKKFKEYYDSPSKPTVEIIIGSKKINTEKIRIENLTVKLTSGYEASSSLIKVIGEGTKFENNKLTFEDNLKDFEIGEEIKINLGYGKQLETVFFGYITSILFDYQKKQEIIYTIECMDGKFLMMNSKKFEHKGYDKSYTTVAEEVLKKYFKKVEVIDYQKDKFQIIQNGQSDYNFILSIAKRLDYLFFVINGKVMFISRTKANDVKLKVSPCDYFYHFTKELSLQDQVNKVTVRSYNQKDPSNPIEASVDNVLTKIGGTKTSSDLSLINSRMEIVIRDDSVTTQSDAEKIAKSEFTARSMKYVTGEIEFIGVPFVEPASYIQIDEINNVINGKYFITEVEHFMDEKEYKTICRYEGNAI